MNIYRVYSETLYNHESMGYEPPERYCTAELVAAKSCSQAKYLACHKGIVTNNPRYQDCWGCAG